MAQKKTKDIKKTEETGEFFRNIKIRYDPKNERQVELIQWLDVKLSSLLDEFEYKNKPCEIIKE
jgi:hypothetical protein